MEKHRKSSHYIVNNFTVESIFVFVCWNYDITHNLLAYLLTAWSRVLLEKLTGFAANQEIPRNFMEPQSSLPYSQAPATCPYPEPTPSSPHNPFPQTQDPS